MSYMENRVYIWDYRFLYKPSRVRGSMLLYIYVEFFYTDNEYAVYGIYSAS
jgi:hypothetical protein